MTSARFRVIFIFHDFKTMSATRIHFFVFYILVLYTFLYFILVLVRKDKIVKDFRT